MRKGCVNKLLEYQVDSLSKKIKHYLITQMGKVAEEANDIEFYRAFSYAVREEIMMNWAACYKTYYKKGCKTLYYLSLEYLPGRLLQNNLINIHGMDLIKGVLHSFGRHIKVLLQCEPEPALGNGGLGRLASCFMDSLATHRYPSIGYGLRYQYGMFKQVLCDGGQQEIPDSWLLNENPWEFRRDFIKTSVKFGGRLQVTPQGSLTPSYHVLGAEEVRTIPYDIPVIGYSEKDDFHVGTVRLWTSRESPNNFKLRKFNEGDLTDAAENMTLTDVLYPNDHHEIGKRIRLKQEFLLVSASLQDIFRRYFKNNLNLENFSDHVVIQINDTHPALAIAEMMRLLLEIYHIEWGQAWDITRSVFNYTNHTILHEALEQWDKALLADLLPRQFAIIEKLNFDFLSKIRKQFPEDEDKIRRMSIIQDGKVRMAHLSILGSSKVNGVARLHTEILKESLFRDFYDVYPEKFLAITNGVTPRRWLLSCNRPLADLISDKIGRKWVTHFEEIKKLREFADDTSFLKRLLEIKAQNKKFLLSQLSEIAPSRDKGGLSHDNHCEFDPHSLFDMQVKRIHEYKRQLLMALHAIILYHELKQNPNSRTVSRTLIFAGKAAAGYRLAKNIIRLIHCIGKKVNHDKTIKNKLKILYVENYNVSKAELIIPAADLSEQISTAGMEASGTGNMKLAINGALTIGTRDGANIEMEEEVGQDYWPFAFGASVEEIAQLKKENHYSPQEICAHNPQIAQALNSLIDGEFTENDEEKTACFEIYQSLTQEFQGHHPDRYFVLKDLLPYYETQKKVEQLYSKPMEWAKVVVQNIAGMGKFSSDRAVGDYVNLIWKLDTCPLDPAILEQIRDQYKEHDKCRIFPEK